MFCVFNTGSNHAFFVLHASIPCTQGGDYINSFISWVGGKKALRDEILLRFPIEYTKYVEVFGGAGWVLFHKPKGKDYEVFNDYFSCALII